MNVVIDTNVVMDALTDRKPFADASTEAIALAGDKGCNVAITANTVTDLYFYSGGISQTAYRPKPRCCDLSGL